MLSLVAEWVAVSLDERAAPEQRARRQARLLRAAACAAYTGTRLYRRLYSLAGMDPSTIRSLDDLPRLPVLDSSWYRRQPLEERLMVGIRPERCVIQRTSGTSGVPLDVYLTRRELARRKAIWYHARRVVGLRPGWKQMTVGGFHAKRITPWAAHWHRYCSVEVAVNELPHYRPHVIHGYPSQLLIFARQLQEAGVRLPKLRALTSGGETLEPSDRQTLESFFGAPLYDFYGCHELGVAARPCPAGPGFHLTSPHVLVEILRDGRPARPGEEGEVVLTSLLSEAMPILRYAVGDTAVAGAAACACGSTRMKIESFGGRAADVIHTPDGRRITAMFSGRPLLPRREVLQYRVTQRALASFLIEVVMHEDLTAEFMQDIQRYYAEAFGSTCTDVRRVPGLQASPSGKHKRFVSLLERAS